MSESMGSGHGHEKHDSHESPAGKHSEWMKHALNVLKAVGIGLAVFAFAPALLSAAAVVLPQYMGYIGLGAGLYYYLDSKYGSAKKDNHAGKQGGHGGH